jgi:hypothetical protein
MSEDTPETGKRSEDEKRVLSQIARSLWTLDQGEDLPKDAEARKAAYAGARKEYRRKAVKLTARLSRRGVALTPTGKPEKTGDA